MYVRLYTRGKIILKYHSDGYILLLYLKLYKPWYKYIFYEFYNIRSIYYKYINIVSRFFNYRKQINVVTVYIFPITYLFRPVPAVSCS